MKNADHIKSTGRAGHFPSMDCAFCVRLQVKFLHGWLWIYTSFWKYSYPPFWMLLDQLLDLLRGREALMEQSWFRGVDDGGQVFAHICFQIPIPV